ncbi:MAG TPA: NYN domain-containing protein [Bacillota bacterium]|nr:NYN domain-containing protein [Bacillota bacterium]
MNILVVDGYNIIGAWETLKKAKAREIAEARDMLIGYMAEYQAYTGDRVIIVFDAYYVHGIASKRMDSKVEIIYTKEKETADECIERIVSDLKNVRDQVYVATSDYAEQRTIFGRGALRKSARELYLEWKESKREMQINIENHRQLTPQVKIPLDKETLEIFEKWRRGSR